MARLPVPGSDNGTWGDVLNDFLQQALKNDGTIKDNAVTANTLAPNSVTNAALASDAVNATIIADGSITEPLLDSSLQTKVNAAGSPDWANITNKPSVATLNDAQTLTNKTLNLTSNTVTGTLTEFNNAISDADIQPYNARLSAMAAATITTGTSFKILSTQDGGSSWTTVSTFSFGRNLMGTGDAAQAAALLTSNATLSGAETLTNKTLSGATVTDATDITLGTISGTKIGTAAAQKIGFFGATPVVQQSATTDLGTVLSNLGLRAVGTAFSLATSGNVAFSGGSVRFGVQTALTGSSTVTTSTQPFIPANATSGPINVTLPSTTTAGYMFTVKKIDASANAVTVIGTIDGATNYVLSTQYKYVKVISTATSGVWYIVGGN